MYSDAKLHILSYLFSDIGQIIHSWRLCVCVCVI